MVIFDVWTWARDVAPAGGDLIVPRAPEVSGHE